MSEVLNLSGVSYAYSSDSVKMNFPDLSLQNSEKVLVLGQSGSGKSTFLSLISGILNIQEGSIHLKGQDIRKLSRSKLDALRAENVGFVFQAPEFINSVSVLDNLLLSTYYAKNDTAEAEELLKEFELYNLRNKYPSELSQGEKQRLAIARAMIHRPSLILADEPTSALDDERAEKVIEILLKASNKFDSSLVVVTHDARVKAHFANIIKLNNTTD